MFRDESGSGFGVCWFMHSATTAEDGTVTSKHKSKSAHCFRSPSCRTRIVPAAVSAHIRGSRTWGRAGSLPLAISIAPPLPTQSVSAAAGGGSTATSNHIVTSYRVKAWSLFEEFGQTSRIQYTSDLTAHGWAYNIDAIHYVANSHTTLCEGGMCMWRPNHNVGYIQKSLPKLPLGVSSGDVIV